MNLITLYKETDDEWYPEYNVNGQKLVKVMLGKLHPEKEEYRVGAWGNDDFGIIKDFDSLEKAEDCFHEVIKLIKVNQQDLYDMGFDTF